MRLIILLVLVASLCSCTTPAIPPTEPVEVDVRTPDNTQISKLQSLLDEMQTLIDEESAALEREANQPILDPVPKLIED